MASESLAKDLEFYRRRKGLTQNELAQQLGVSQPHLSRLLSGGAMPGVKLRSRIAKVVGSGANDVRETEWSRTVAKMAARSPSFRELVDAALRILDER